MVSSSKILTVSYGTFSCTAEGFEDPLGVVKDTTHFFRGIVHEDRFFGAEPPQFDPELASQLLQAQVASEAGEGALTLRNPYRGGGASPGALSAALSAGPVTVRKAPQPAPAPVEEAEVAAERDDDPRANLAEDEPRQGAIAPAEEAATPAEAPTQQIHQSAENQAVAEETADEVPADLSTPEDEDLALADSIAAALAESDVVPPYEGPLAAASGADSLEAEAEYFEDIEEVTPPPARPRPSAAPSDPESVAAKLRRIRDVVSAGKSDAAPQAPEPEMPGPLPVSDERSIADAAADDVPGATGAASVEAAESAVASDAPLPPVRRARARVVKVKRAQFDAAVAGGALESLPESPDAAAREQVSSLSREDEDELARELAAVKAELEADFGEAWKDEDAPEAGASPRADEHAEVDPSLEADDDADDWDFGDDWDEDDAAISARASFDDDVADDPATQDDTAHIADDPADELADDMAGGGFDDDAWDDEEDEEPGDEQGLQSFDETGDENDRSSAAPADEADRATLESARKAVKMSSPARAMLTEKSVRDNDASRILDETNTQLEEPEGNRRRSAIAHLRAAVAATRADKLLGRKADSEEVIEPYREDLANAVRPRRPQAPESHTERPVEPARQAPLKLVAEQRVDATMAPARPRRVRLSDFDEGVGADEEVGDFAEYARSVGASDLPELLEAAAAYMSFVEGREQFSRPQLMTKVRQAEASESSREDRLRSFGQLLREGKIEKTRGGRFTASERISFKPDARAAG